MNVDQLMVALTRSAESHDENTGESHNDLAALLRAAVLRLDAAGQLQAFVDDLKFLNWSDVNEYEWLKK